MKVDPVINGVIIGLRRFGGSLKELGYLNQASTGLCQGFCRDSLLGALRVLYLSVR